MPATLLHGSAGPVGAARCRLGTAVFELLALPVVLGTAARVARLDRRLGLDALVEALRDPHHAPLPRRLSDPERLAGAVERFLRLLPPWRHGLCLRRSLLLFALWTRCGLRVTLHLGFSPQRAAPGGHAWLSASAPDGSVYRISEPFGATVICDL